MKDPNDTRDVLPRPGSPLWIHLIAVSVAGATVLGLSLTGLNQADAHHLIHSPLLWTIAILIMVGELRPIITPGRSGSESGVASITFAFAALLYWGLPVAALLKAAATLVAGTADRRAPFRSVFNAAQEVLALGAASAALGLAGIHPEPARPWLPTGGQLAGVGLAALVFFAVNFALVLIAIGLHTRTRLLEVAQDELPYQAFVNLALLSAAPLVVVVMGRSAVLVLLFLLPLVAVYLNAAVSVEREHQAMHDELTGLPNRTLLLRRTADALAAASRSGGVCGFLLLDLDRFKEVNDTLGHPAGDRLLRTVAHRLAHSVRPGDLVARLGGDEFAVLLPVMKTPGTAREVAARLRAALAEPVRLDGVTLHMEASVGIASYPADALDVELLMQRADVAMYLAKEHHTGVEGYDPARDRNSPARLSLLGDLRRAVDRGQLELAFQPAIRLADDQPAGLEAVMYWDHPQRGLVPAGECTEITGHAGLSRDLTRHLIESALNQTSAWWQSGLPVPVSLSVTTGDLLDGSLARLLANELGYRGLPPEALVLQVSERALAAGPDPADAAVRALAAIGIEVSLDDFGTGYSSLARLKRLPVAEIKIDASFVQRLPGGTDDELIVRSLVGLARALGIRSVAKGVSSAQTVAALRTLGCEAAQGPQLSRRLPPAQATVWLHEHLPAQPTASPAEPLPRQPQPAAGPPRPAARQALSPSGTRAQLTHC